jgi:transposase-like protein
MILSCKKSEKYNSVVEMYQSGLSVREIASLFGITHQAMWKILKRRLPELRSQKQIGIDNKFYRGGIIYDKKSHHKVENAVKHGYIKRPESCEECGHSGKNKDGRTALRAHHDDYNKPMEVRWLCHKCHYTWHENNKPILSKGDKTG